jgi:arabinogalactan endo-1,4-beta-galactosidase
MNPEQQANLLSNRTLRLWSLGAVLFLIIGYTNYSWSNSETSGPSSPFFLGADISELPEIEQQGGVYMDGDKPADAVALLMKHGWTCLRLRIWVDPRNGACGLEYTKKLAKRIKDAGGTFMLDFHYSDWWADPQKQNKPAAWARLDFDALLNKVLDYTTEVVKALKEAGATPDFVQIGNEITGGTLWPDAQVKVPLSTVKVFSGDVVVIKPPDPYDDDRQWRRLIRVLKAASTGVRSATTASDHTRIIIHIDCGGDWPVTKWYFDHLTEAGIDYDIIGQSFYPNWHGTMQNLRDNLRETIKRYHKDVMVVETAYPTRDVHPVPAAAKNMIWPMTPEGQKQFLADLIKTVKETPEHRGIGVNYWRPELTYIPHAAGYRSGPDANSLFDSKGCPLPAMYVLDSQRGASRLTADRGEQ